MYQIHTNSMVVVCCGGIKITINKATITMTIESAPPIIYGATTVVVCGVVPIPITGVCSTVDLCTGEVLLPVAMVVE